MAKRANRESEEMYLEAILLLRKNSSNVRSVDVMNELGLAKSSTSRGMHLLIKKGYITMNGESGVIEFTPEEEARGRRLRASPRSESRHYETRRERRTCRAGRLPYRARRIGRAFGTSEKICGGVNERFEMLKDKKCPYCGTMNKGLDLKESDGLYVCSNCERVVDTKKDEPRTDDETKSK